MHSGSSTIAFSDYRRLFAVPVIVGIALFSTLVFIGISGLQMARHHAPLVDAVMEMRYELTMFHLRFEEYLAYVQEHGATKQVPVQLAWKHLAQSQWYARALLFGGNNQEGVFVPLDNPQLRQDMKTVLEALKVLRTVAKQRHSGIQAGNYDKTVEQHFDVVFENVLQKADEAETTLHITMNEEVATFQRLLIILSLLSVVLMLAMAVVRYRHEFSRRRYEAQLKESRDRINLLLNSTAEAIYGLDLNGNCTFANPACIRLLGYENMDDVLGKNMHDLIHHTRPDGSPYPMQECHINEAFQTGEGTHIDDEVLWRMDGTSFAAEYWSYPIYEGGQIAGSVVTFLDITKRSETEKVRQELMGELEEKASEMERFVYTVSHDLKSPLITIKGFLGLLEKDADKGDKERLKGDIRQIHKAADGMEELLADLLEISRIGRVSNPSEEVKLNELTAEVVEMLSLQLKKSGAQVKIMPGLPVLFVDRKRMFEVMQNLIENALKFMGEQEHPLIEIGVRQQAEEEIVYVSDNGIGIELPYHEKVFGLFERLHPNVDGTGIGLAIVKRIIDLNHGRIWVESEGEGKGATFCFTVSARE